MVFGLRSSVLSRTEVPRAGENVQGDTDRRFVRMFDCSKVFAIFRTFCSWGGSVVVHHRRPCLVSSTVMNSSSRIEQYAGDRVERSAYNGDQMGLYLREGMCSAPVKHDATSTVELEKKESALHVLE